MYFVLSLCLLVARLICLSESGTPRSKLCYQAKICIHNAVEKCGVNGKGKLRKFFDKCDILEYNCLKGTDYAKTSHSKCASLPDIDKQKAKEDFNKDESDQTTPANKVTDASGNGAATATNRAVTSKDDTQKDTPNNDSGSQSDVINDDQDGKGNTTATDDAAQIDEEPTAERRAKLLMRHHS